jgi:glycosyltransferase involved in cell wall biosynthesis
VPQLLDALRRLDASVVATIVGGPGEEGPEWSASLREGAADLVAAGRVSFPGELAPDEVGAELRRAHLFVLPSRAEGTPLALLEAMAVGRPVVVGDAGNVRQVVAAAGCGDVLDERTPDALAAAIRRALADPAALARHGAAAHASALAEHATDARMSEVEALLAAAEARR